ncbi:MAG: DNA-processing protein DprA [Lachnospiraceae bacterium]|nr:DNA-processing protein DprA [Lachnospiraceae bacterium]
MPDNREVLYFLQTVPGIGNKTIRELWNYFKDADALFHANEEQLSGILSTEQTRAFLEEREKETPAERLAKLKKNGIRYCSIFDWDYPARLRVVSDCPLSLFVKGSLPQEKCMTAAVVGARNHSYYGEKQTKLFAGVLVQRGIEIISGMARGIDSIAQKAAIENGGRTYAVLGCGADICYPKESRALFEQIPEHGGIISEYLPGTTPKAGLFPMRNRIISALGDILLVMEAREKSGTLITVDMALEQGKEIWVLPGRIDDVLSCGCNRLISQGAGILTGISEFSKELEGLQKKYGISNEDKNQGRHKKERTCERTKSKQDKGMIRDDYSDGMKMTSLEKEILSLLDYQPVTLEGIYEKLLQNAKASHTIQEVSTSLLNLCVKRLAIQTNGFWYIRA